MVDNVASEIKANVPVVKLIKIEPFSKYNYSMLTFEVNGVEKKAGLSDSMLLEIITDKQKQAFKKDFFSENHQTVPLSALSVL